MKNLIKIFYHIMKIKSIIINVEIKLKKIQEEIELEICVIIQH